MSAILSSDDLNDFISPGVACIKPVETLPKQRPDKTSNPYEVTTEEKAAADPNNAPPAQISLTDCLACSGCVTSAEAVLISLQSHEEVLTTLDNHRSLSLEEARNGAEDGKVFVASVSPQTRASIAATYGTSESEAGNMIAQLLSGPQGVKSGGKNKSGFTWVIDTNTVRELCQRAVVQEVEDVVATPKASITTDSGSANDAAKLPVLASACPGWICYAEKTHPHVLPHLSRLKSPQAMMGTILKSVLSRCFGVSPANIWHVAIMPCFDKKLEASREELTDVYWTPDDQGKQGVRDVDCVITARELIMLADSRGVSFPLLPKTPLSAKDRTPFPDPALDALLFLNGPQEKQTLEGGPSGAYAYHIVKSFQSKYPGSEVLTERGRNTDVIEYSLICDGKILLKTARYYGFKNIQNLVRKLKPAKKSKMPGSKLAARAEASRGAAAAAMSEYAYIEVMACPGGCTNGGGQIKVSDLADLTGSGESGRKPGPQEQKEWLARVDEAYYSADSSDEEEQNGDQMDVDMPNGTTNGANGAYESKQLDVESIMKHWTSTTGIERTKLMCTGYRQVESDVGKDRNANDMERVAGLASTIGGGW